MNKHYSKTLVAAAVAGAMAGGVSGTASAFEYAMSHLFVNGLVFIPNNPADVAQSFTFGLTNTAALNGVPTIQIANCNGTPTGTLPGNNCNPGVPVLNALPASVPGGTRVDNNFSFIGPSNVTSYASSDSVIYTASLVTGPVIGTSVEGIAEVNVAGNGDAQGSSQINSTTTVTLNDIAITGGGFTLLFNADPDMRSAIASLPGIHSATSNLLTTITLTNNDGLPILVTWSPQGTAVNNCIAIGATCAELADTQDLNISLPTGINPSDLSHSLEAAIVATPFGLFVGGLPTGNYSLALSTTQSANVVSQIVEVPEPASLALVALGLLGIGAGVRRRNRKV